jgi:S1-C subfamily serine protease
LILTAAHVVEGARSIEIRTADGKFAARVVQIDKANDVALLRCEGDGRFPALRVAGSSHVRAGQTVFTIGFPQIEMQGVAPKFTKGDINSASGFQDDPRHWQISAPVQPGNSGGPLLDEGGNIIGIVVARLDLEAAAATGSLPQNVNYALKSAYFRALLEENGVRVDAAPAKTTGSIEDTAAQAQKAAVMVLVYGKDGG